MTAEGREEPQRPQEPEGTVQKSPAGLTTLRRQALEETGSPVLDANPRAFYTGLAIVLLSVFSALATYLILTGLTPIVPRNEVVLGVLLTNVVLLAAMAALILWQVLGLARAWRAKAAGARLHIRIIILFSIIAAVPAILLAVAATTTFSRSLDSWFSARTQAIIESSVDVAKAYLEEHGQVIRNDLANMARDIGTEAENPPLEGVRLTQFIQGQAALRDLAVAFIIDGEGKPVLAAAEDPALPYLPPPREAIEAAEAGHVAVLPPPADFRISALTKLSGFPGRYLYVARSISPTIKGYLQRAEQNALEYSRLRRAQGGLTLAHALMYTMISMTALLAAIWTGMWFAGRFVAPIRRLISAAAQVTTGNLDLVLPERRGEGDLRRLSQMFNNMTRELKHQRDALISANEQLTERRRFMEAVLSGVSAGVIGLDAQGRITIANRSARTLLALPESGLVGRTLAEAVPPLAAFVERLAPGRGRKQQQLTLTAGGDERVFAVRVTHEHANAAGGGSVVTFDDITELVSAQRTSAWADVARRIAHEIKNPLTPIILSAERIRRKYGKVIVEDRDTFDKLTATIERQAGDIKSMVDEFASFARVPKSQMEESDLRDAVQDPVILYRESHPHITYSLVAPEAPVIASFDRRLMTQAVTNLVKNATEAVEAAAGKAEPGWRGHIEIALLLSGDGYEIEVTDNGVGLPKQNRSRLLEPYVTTRAKGTGLGLAIVQKIVEEHGGTLALEDAPKTKERRSGALVRITLPPAAPGGAQKSGAAGGAGERQVPPANGNAAARGESDHH